jgi:hypothetical protein
MSNLENLSDVQLEKLIKLTIHFFKRKASNVDYTNLAEIFEFVTLEILDEIGNYFGIKNMELEDYSFITELLELNAGHETGDSIIRPTLKNFKVVEYEILWVKTKYTYSNEISSYTDLDYNLLSHLKENDFYTIYDGKTMDEEILDQDFIDDGLDGIKRLK